MPFVPLCIKANIHPHIHPNIQFNIRVCITVQTNYPLCISDESYMELFESHTNSFIIKIWVEEAPEKKGRVVWHGSINHVPSGQRRHFTKLKDISLFILPYLQTMGVKPPWWWRIQQRFKQRKQSTSGE